MKNCLVIGLMGLMALVFSCDTKPNLDAVAPLIGSDEINVLNGALRFNDFAHFERVVSQLTKTQSRTNLDSWQGQFAGFTSMRSAFKGLTADEINQISSTKSAKGYENFLLLKEDGDDLEAVRVIDSEVLAAIFSREGVVRFGNDAFKYTEGKVYVVRDFAPQKLSNLEQVKESIDLNIKNKRNARLLDTRNECIENYRSGGYNRLVGDYTLVTPFLGSNSGPFGGPFKRIKAAAKSQKRVFGIWWDNAIPSLELKVRGATYLNFGPAPIFYDSGVEYNEADVLFEQGLDDGTGTAVVTWLEVTANGLCDDNQPRTCTTRY